MTIAIAVLVSVGRHPASGRARRADRDSRDSSSRYAFPRPLPCMSHTPATPTKRPCATISAWESEP
jgi:hypothetical protein